MARQAALILLRYGGAAGIPSWHIYASTTANRLAASFLGCRHCLNSPLNLANGDAWAMRHFLVALSGCCALPRQKPMDNIGRLAMRWHHQKFCEQFLVVAAGTPVKLGVTDICRSQFLVDSNHHTPGPELSAYTICVLGLSTSRMSGCSIVTARVCPSDLLFPFRPIRHV